MPEPLATVEQLQDRIGELIEGEENYALAQFMLRHASAQARHYGLSKWTRFGVPEVVQTTVIDVAARGYDNSAGYEMERGQMLTIQREAVAASGARFTKDEQAICRKAAGNSGFYSITLIRPDVMSDQIVSGSSGGGGDGSSFSNS